jgi:hypothetical protein
MALSRDLALSDAERDAILDTEWNLRIATVSPSGRINATPLWFVLVDRAEKYMELQGIMIQGDAVVLEDAAAEEAEPALAEVQAIFGRKYRGGRGEAPTGEPVQRAATARGRTWRWVKITPSHIVTWDNRKLPR